MDMRLESVNGVCQSRRSAICNSKMSIKFRVFPLIVLFIEAYVSVGGYERLVKCSGVTGQAGWCHSSDLLLHYCGVTGQVQI